MISDILSGIALVVSIFTYFATRKQLGHLKKAMIYPVFHKEMTPRAIVITNRGQGEARNIRVEHEPDNPMFREPSGSVVCDWLPPNQDCKVWVNFDYHMEGKYRQCVIVWDDDYGKNQRRDYSF